MRILVDIIHPCDVNFFRALVQRLLDEGHTVEMVYLDRGKVPALVAYEYPEVPATKVGVHASSRWGLYLRTGLLRELQLGRHMGGAGFDVVIGFPGWQTAMVAKALGAKSIGCYDDPEHRPNMLLSQAFCDVLVLPEYLEIEGRNVRPMRALKEWAYLSPAHFTPRLDVLDEYGLRPKEYVFIREVEPRSLNYQTQSDVIRGAYEAGLRDETVVLSLEDKRRRPLFDGWTILEEPVSDIYSLMHYAKLVVSSGDSMAREGAQLATPSIYAGERSMKANDALYRRGLMDHVEDPHRIVARARAAPPPAEEQAELRQKLFDEWDDVPDVLLRALAEVTGGGPGR